MTTLAELLVQETKTAIYERALSIATTVGLPVTTWEDGDPTRSLYHVLAETLEYLEIRAARYVASGFLDLAAQLDDTKWLKKTAYQKYGYTATEATYSTCTVQLSNTSGNVYTIAAYDLTFAKTSDADITYRNTTGGTLGAGTPTSPETLDVTVACEIAGSDGSASIGDLELVTNVLGTTASNTTAAVGVDEESTTSIVAGCRAKLEALSPNGAAGAYEYVGLKTDYTDADDVTRISVSGESTSGEVTIYVASSSGAASGTDVTAVENALTSYAAPLCITPSVSSASAYPVTVTATVLAYDSVGVTTSAMEDAIDTALGTFFAAVPIGGDGDDGKVYRASIISAILNTYPNYIYQVSLTAPASDVDLSANEVATLNEGASSVSVTLESA